MRIFKSIGCLLVVLLAAFSTVSNANTTRIQIINWQYAPPAALRVGYVSRVPDANMIVVRKHTTYWVTPGYGQGRIRITVPVDFYLSSWDVKALERELERLGIKVKPKPVPKPGPVLSG